jgi:hypothetical protein
MKSSRIGPRLSKEVRDWAVETFASAKHLRRILGLARQGELPACAQFIRELEARATIKRRRDSLLQNGFGMLLVPG